MRRLTIVLLSTLVLGLLSFGCKSKDLNDPEYLAEQIRAGNSRALREVPRMEVEAQIEMIPALLDAFDEGLSQRDILGILVDIGHESAIPAFMEALNGDHNRYAGLAARGLANVGATDRVPDIVARLRRVDDPGQYEPFLDALRRMPGRPEVAEVLNEILMRRANRIGGIETVRLGCHILGSSGDTSDATIDSIIFGLVNYVPQPYRVAHHECILALVEIGTPAVPRLLRTFRGENEEAITHLQRLGSTGEVARLHAANALALLGDPAGLDDVVSFFTTLQQLDTGMLSSMPFEQQQAWYTNYGQAFGYAAHYLGRIATDDAEDLARQTLLQIVMPGEESLVNNFRQFLNTSGGATYGLRLEAMTALSFIGNPADRLVFLDMAQTGTSGMDNALVRQAGAQFYGLMSQPGDLVTFQEMLGALNDSAVVEQVANYESMVELAETCAHDVACLGERLDHEDGWIRMKAAYDLAHFVGDENQVAAAQVLLDHLDHPSPDTRRDIVTNLRNLPLPPNAEERIQSVLEDSEGGQLRDFRFELRVLREIKLRL